MVPVFVSVDEVDPAALTEAKYEVPFPLLSDPEAKVLEAFNVVHELTPDEYERLRGFKIDVESYSGKKHHKIARAALFLVAKDGTVLWAHADKNYKKRPSLDQVLGAIGTALEDSEAGSE